MSEFDSLKKHEGKIIQLCVKHKVQSLYAFGSILTDKFTKTSDIDLIVDFSAIALDEYADNYFDFKFALQDILQRPIDLLEEKTISNPYFRQSIDQHKLLLYGH